MFRPLHARTLGLARHLIIATLSCLALAACKKDGRELKDADPGKLTVLTLPPGYNNPRNSEGDFITLKDGSLLFVYTHFTGSTTVDDAPAYLASRLSTDSGKTWTTNDDLVTTPGEGIPNVMSVSLLRLQNGEIVLLYLSKKSLQDCIPMMRISKDEGNSWSAAVPVVKDKKGYFTLNNNRMIQLSSGRIIVPVSQHYSPSYPFTMKGTLMTYYSDDNGQTWLCSKPVPNSKWVTLQEPGVVALKNGNIMLWARTDQNVQYTSLSEDSGRTWREIAPSNIVSPLAPASISRIPSTGDLLLAWNNNNGEIDAIKGRRTPYNLAISSDEGATWTRMITLENNPDGWYAYTAIHHLGHYIFLAHSDGRVSKGTQQSVIAITRLDVNWLYKRLKS